jgi:hypothetical protein
MIALMTRSTSLLVYVKINNNRLIKGNKMSKYIDKVIETEIRDKIHDAYNHMVERSKTMIGTSNHICDQIYVKLHCVFDCTVAQEIKALVDKTTAEIYDENPLPGMLYCTGVYSKNIETTDDDGQYFEFNDCMGATICLDFIATVSIGTFSHAIEMSLKNITGLLGSMYCTNISFYDSKDPEKRLSVLNAINALEQFKNNAEYSGVTITIIDRSNTGYGMCGNTRKDQYTEYIISFYMPVDKLSCLHKLIIGDDNE